MCRQSRLTLTPLIAGLVGALIGSSAQAITFAYSGHLDSYVAPTTGLYRLTAWGARGGDRTKGSHPQFDGSGIGLTGKFHLTQGETLVLAVGSVGAFSQDGIGFGGGGGGSFIIGPGSQPLLIAGGGGGGNGRLGDRGGNAVATTSGAAGLNGRAHGGIAGLGAEEPHNGGGGGGGFLSDGVNIVPFTPICGGSGFPSLAGGQCGYPSGAGGFGGGGAGEGYFATVPFTGGGGGGGYSGGGGGGGAQFIVGGGWQIFPGSGGGGGGGSFNGGLNPAVLGYNNDYGWISIDPTSAPEPAAWALMLAGFGLVGERLRRRRLSDSGTPAEQH